MHMKNRLSDGNEDRLKRFKEIFNALDGLYKHLGINGQYKEQIKSYYNSILENLREGKDYKADKGNLALSAYFALVPRHLDIKERTGVDDIRDGYPYEEGIDKTKFALDVRDCIISEDLAGLRSLYGNARKTRQNV